MKAGGREGPREEGEEKGRKQRGKDDSNQGNGRFHFIFWRRPSLGTDGLKVRVFAGIMILPSCCEGSRFLHIDVSPLTELKNSFSFLYGALWHTI